MAEKRDYYEVLEVTRTATTTEITASFRKLAMKYHPDRNPGDADATARFKECAEAYEVLNDDEKRARYDRYGHAGVGNGSGHFSDVNDIFSAFGDIFDLFGGGGGRRGGGRRVQRGADVRADVTLELSEAAVGVTKTIRFHHHEKCETCNGSGAKSGTKPVTCDYCGGRGQIMQSSGFFRVQTTCPACHGAGTVVKDPCSDCRGAGAVERKVEREVKIPAGVDSDTRLRLTGEGDQSPNGGPPGDCYVFIEVREHELFQRQGQTLICQVPITYPQAVLGATIEVPTLDGRQELEIPRGTQAGDVFRLRGKGMPDPHRRGKGDLIVQVEIEVPKKVTPREEELLRELAEEERTNVSPKRKSFLDKLRDYFMPSEQTDE